MEKYRFLDTFCAKSYALLYILVARILALTFVHFALMKIFVQQFEESYIPALQMAPAGSFQAAHQLFFFAYVLSYSYEFILGVLELLAIILMWIPRTVILVRFWRGF